MGTPKRWVLPTTTSAPSAPGDLTMSRAMMSAAIATMVPAACAFSTSAEGSSRWP